MKNAIIGSAIVLSLGLTSCVATVAARPPRVGMVLVEGRWVNAPRLGAVWVDGHYARHGFYRREWVPGHWRY
jgi:hypothetical protein